MYEIRLVNKMKETTVLGIRVSVTTKTELRKLIKQCIEQKRKLALVAVNARKVMRARESREMRQLLDGFDVFLADGASIVHACSEPLERITGVDLMEDLCAHAKELGLRIFLYGAKRENNEKARQALIRRFPSLNIVGSCDGYRDESVVEKINDSKAKIVFVAKGTPAQEQWIAAHKQEVCANVFLGVGGALDIWSDALPRAPRWIQDLGFEWLFRMMLEPKRFLQLPQLYQFQRLVMKEKRKGR